jgi:uncharacterized protein YfaS (alpha-2-macroglobulin family)
MKSKIGSWIAAIIFAALTFGIFGVGVSSEVPLGGVRGTVTTEVGNHALGNAYVQLVPVSYAVDREIVTKPITTSTNAKGEFTIKNIPAGVYSVVVESRYHQTKRRTVHIIEGAISDLSLVGVPTIPHVELYVSRHVVSPSAEPKITLHGVDPAPSAIVKLYQIPPERMLKDGGLERALAPVNLATQKGTQIAGEAATLVKEFNLDLKERDPEGVFSQEVKLPKAEEGVYWMAVEMGKFRQGNYLVVTQNALVVKSAGRKALAYLADIDTGAPVAGANIVNAQGSQSANVGTTGPDGTFQWDVSTAFAEGSLVCAATKGKSFAVASFYVGNREQQYDVFVKTDRPVYRPGDKIEFKSTIRKRTSNGPELPNGGNVITEIHDPQGDTIQTTTTPISSFGSVSGAFQTRTGVVGAYEIITEFAGQRNSEWVTTASYRKPEFRIVVNPTKPLFIGKESVQVKVDCSYYFGGPVPGAKLNCTIFRRPRWEIYAGDEDWDEGEGDYEAWQGDYVGDIQGVTGDDGSAILTFEPPADAGKQRFGETDAVYTFEVSGSATGEKFFEGKGAANWAQADIGLIVEPEKNFIGRGETTKVLIDLQKIGSDVNVANRTVEVAIGRMQWNARNQTFLLDRTETVTTDAQGKASVNLSADRPGDYSVRVTAKDDRGNSTTQEAYVWIWGEQETAPEDSVANLKITLDKRQYNPGEKVKGIVTSSGKSKAALITLERESVRWHQVIMLSSKATEFEFQMPQGSLPKATVAATAIAESQSYESSANLNVDREVKRLKVTVTADKQMYRPGDRAEYTVKATDANGPVQADLSVALVDEAIFAIRADNDDPVKTFYPKTWNEVNTTTSLNDVYLDGGDKSPSNIDIRQKFQDTAFWTADLRTDEEGIAHFVVDLPDNVTSWRATATAITANTYCGVGVSNVAAKKPVMVVLSPRGYLVKCDELELVATIHNNSGQSGQLDTQIVAPNLELLDNARQMVQVADGKTAVVRWRYKTKLPKETTITVTTKLGEFSDGMRLTIPSYEFGRESITPICGELAPGADEFTLKLDRDTRATQGDLTLTVSPTLGKSILAGLGDLIDYPYGCVEQTMSRFMPAVVAFKAANDLGLKLGDRAKMLPDVVAQSLQRLGDMRQSNGGWGWFGNDTSSAGMTALVLEGLYRAKEAGYAIPQYYIDNALQFGAKYLDSNPTLKTPYDVEEAIYLAYACALYDRSEASAARLNHLAGRADTDLALAYAVLGRIALGQTQGAEFARLRESVSESEATAWLDLKRSKSYSWRRVEATARLLQILAKTEPGSPLTSKVVRYLMQERRGNGWYSTKDTAQVLVGLTQVMAVSRELSASGSITVQIGDRASETINVTPATALNDELSIQVPVADLNPATTVRISTSGGITAYYSGRLSQFIPEKQIQPKSLMDGLSVTRTFHGLEARKDQHGDPILAATQSEITRFTAGNPVRCIVKVKSATSLSNILVKVPIPSNLFVQESEQTDSWNWWFNGLQIFDDHVAFFVTQMDAGEHTFEFNLRAEAAGTSMVLPATAMSMYDPSIWASSGGGTMQVNP